MAERRPTSLYCALPTTCSAEETELYRLLRETHCAAGRDAHHCVGQVTIDREGITLSCPRCGDARSVYPAANRDG